MEESKSVFKSKTIISSLVGASLTLGLIWGVATQEEVKAITDLLLDMTPQLLQLLAFAGAVYGRIKAKTKITLK